MLASDESRFAEMYSAGCIRRVGESGADDERYALQFVGAAFASDTVLVCAPKFCDERPSDDDLRLTFRSIAHYRARARVRAPSISRIDDILLHGTGSRFVDLLRRLLQWTDRHGFHQEFVQSRVNRDGAIDWGYTVKSRMAVHTSDAVVYHRPVYTRRISRYGRLRVIQAETIARSVALLGPLTGYVTGAKPELISEAKRISATVGGAPMTVERASRILREFARETNRDHEIELIGLLRALMRDLDMSRQDRLRILGTNAFFAIWQAACGSVLALTPGHTSTQSTALLAALRQHNDALASDWILPDHLLKPDDDANVVLVLDAKWHSPVRAFSSNDLVKQFLYEIAVRPNVRVVSNTLIVPGDGPLPERCGEIRAEIDGVCHPGFNAIRVVSAPWREILRDYVESTGDELAAAIVSLARR